MIIPSTMYCRKCRTEKPFRAFVKCGHSKVGRMQWCYQCYRQTHPNWCAKIAGREVAVTRNTDAHRAVAREYARRIAAQLDKRYIIRLLRSAGFRREDIDAKLISKKRESLQSRRMARLLRSKTREKETRQ